MNKKIDPIVISKLYICIYLKPIAKDADTTMNNNVKNIYICVLILI